MPILIALAIVSGPILPASAASAADQAATAATNRPLEFSDKGVPDPRLEGKWKLAAVDGTPVPRGKRWPKAFIVWFKAGEVTGMNACNGFFGPYRVVGSDLQTVLGQTTAGCASPVPDKWDEATMAAVSGGHFEVSSDGAKLTLSAPGAPTYVFRRR